ncbi:hypothetical protein [Yinghuangia soli]|uniref:Uncharacterized protein n=1 Tax=Yinghuangia soli TaxID=2908204 RepID=A0AA41U4K7_9ACTN|nr:hypothetical protein [Yinghuangia soli]MCF2529124.1 hypothetical protein [Yinghuangia soli]
MRGNAFKGECVRVFVVPYRVLRRRGPAAIPLALVATFLVALFHIVQQFDWGKDLTRILGGVRADLPWWLALLRTPVSLFVPAPDLPVWGALAQVLIVFAIAEILLGRARTLVIAYLATLAGTMAARAMIALGPDRVLGIDPALGHVLDTGPSAAVVGLAVAVAWTERAVILMAVVWGLMIAEVAWKPNLAGREHLIGMAAVLVYVVVADTVRRGREVGDAVEWTAGNDIARPVGVSAESRSARG